MAQQIKVNSSTGNIQIQISRGAIGPSTTANVANTALNLNAASTANVVIGGGVNGYVLSTDGLGVTSWVAQTGGGGSAPGGANTQIQYNDAGTLEGDATFTFDNTTDVVSASHFSGEAGNLSNIQGANVSGAVANATHATISDSANLVAVANVSGIGNIATVNLDGNAANFLDGTGSFGPAGGGGGTYGDSNVVTLLNAFGSNTITTTGLITGDGGGLSNIAGANISGAVANATHATVADSANAVAGANVTGEVAFAAVANSVAGANVTGEVAFAAVANSVALANVAGAGNIASINLDGNTANYLGGTGVWGPVTALNANFANFAGNVTLSNQPNITQTGNLLTFTTNDAVANSTTHQIDPALVTMPVNYSDTEAQEVITMWGDDITPNYYGGDGTTTFLMNDINNIQGWSPIVTDYAANDGAGGYARTVRQQVGVDFIGSPPGVGNNFAVGRVEYTFAGQQSEMNSGNEDTLGSVKLSQNGLRIATGTKTATGVNNGVWDLFYYGSNVANEAQGDAIGIRRRRGNGASRLNIAASDYLGNIQWQGLYSTGSGQGPGAKLAPRVSSTFTGSGTVPVGIELYTTDNTGTEHLTEFKSDGQTELPGNLTLNNAGIFTGDGGGLSNVSTGPLGNLSSLTVNDGVANTATHQIDPTLITMPVNYSDTKAQEVITLFGDDNSPNYFGGQGTTTFLMNDINTGTPGFSPVITDYAASNGASGYSQAVRIETGMDFVGVPPSGTNAYAPGRVQYSFAGAQSDLNNADTLGSVKLNQTGVTIQPNTQASTSGIINVFHYGTDPSDATDANGLDFQRRRGNNASRVDIAAGDYLGNIRWAGRKASGFQGNKARLGGRVSTTWNGTDNNIPTDLFFRTQDNTGTSYDVEFKADGQAEFPGNLTLNGSGIFTGDGGGLSNISATVSPGGFFDTIQFNNGGTLDGNSSFQFIPGSLPEVQLNGSAGASPARFLLQDGILNIYTQDLSGGYSPFSFDTHNNLTGFMEPINYRRTRGTRAAQTAVQTGDQVKNERLLVYADAGNINLDVGGQISTVQANDGLGNVAVTTSIRTAKPVSGPNSLDKILLDTEFVELAGNIAMPIATKATAKATFPRLAQTPFTVATLPTASVNIGERAMITDGPASWTGGTLATTSGTNQAAPVYYDGSDWRFG